MLYSAHAHTVSTEQRLRKADILRRVTIEPSVMLVQAERCVRLSTGWLGRDNQPVVADASATQQRGMSAQRLHPTAQQHNTAALLRTAIEHVALRLKVP